MRHEIGSFYEIGKDVEKTAVSRKEDAVERRSSLGGKEGSLKGSRICLEEKGLENWMRQASGGMDALLLCSGREAVEAVLMDMAQQGKASGKVCLLPQYTCDTTIIPFEKQGWELHFFPVGKSLRTEKESFQKLLRGIAPDVLFAHAYYGVDTLAEVRECIQNHQEKGMIFVEDMTQSLALWKKGGIADYYVGSLRKWFPVPDGGFAAAGRKLLVSAAGEKKLFVEQKRKAQSLKYQYLCGQEVEKDVFLKLNRAAEQYLYENDQVSAISEFSRDRLQNLDIQINFQRRKENASCLFQGIGKLSKVRAPLELKDASPLYVPVYADEREKLQEFLKDKNIFAPVLWPVPKQVEGRLGKDVEFIFRHLLALPCDQRYGKKDMEFISQCLLEFEQK